MKSPLVIVFLSGVVLSSLIGCLNGADDVKEAIYNQPYDLRCGVVDDGIEIEWKFGGDIITINSEKPTHYETFPSNNTLRVHKVVPGRTGIYTCTAIDSAGVNQTQTFNLVVLPYVQEFEKSKNVIQGDPLTLVCSAWAVPEPTISWYHNGKKMAPEDMVGHVSFKNGTVVQQSTFPVLENGTLRVDNMDYVDAGNYSCLARNQYGEANATVLVQVKDKYAALWPFLGICAEVAILCTIILIYEKRRSKRLEEEERQEEAAHLNINNDTKTPVADDVRQRK